MVWPLGKVVVKAKRPINNVYFEIPRVGKCNQKRYFCKCFEQIDIYRNKVTFLEAEILIIL